MCGLFGSGPSHDDITNKRDHYEVRGGKMYIFDEGNDNVSTYQHRDYYVISEDLNEHSFMSPDKSPWEETYGYIFEKDDYRDKRPYYMVSEDEYSGSPRGNTYGYIFEKDDYRDKRPYYMVSEGEYGGNPRGDTYGEFEKDLPAFFGAVLIPKIKSKLTRG